MRKENMHQSVEVLYKKVDECPIVNSQFSFFQLVYVISGNGFLHINGNCISYQTGNLMLLTPNDYHTFDISNTTEFLLVKLNSEYVKEYRSKSIDHIECLLHYATHLSGCILKRKEDEFLVSSISESLIRIIDSKDIYDEDLIIHYVNALIVIAARNIAKIKPPGIKESADKRVLEIINYIQANIFCPQRLKVSVIAEQFDISDSYLGSYFKNHCGETIQSFVSNYKIRLIEHRLNFSDMRINEIVDEFGFSDESHLNKFFKKHRNISLTGYRKAKVFQN
ncbi:AraC family transcriptional regulator [Flavobacterium aquidurense]|jgi:AraC-like DNA-binding protein|uniref:AraC family transcriptional regulator n=1 Tax=Flavobacterium aquidurense TaxID=362413 RepID=UPI0009107903|nr:AraC family transcriptional regulator [Flavobacterium aquidurense]OXA70057.1 AraC family transcriptional regulator [Flavobacterium aquidurense]SHG12553.1 AraC-type DNA-binding protein [Flavobacterium frigidimaris]